ncbi:MAG: ISAs1 family transposase, partial [Clostridiales bacterium]|nr:ISAs1 family transposase [Clostridiales bacterium]
TIGAIHTEFTKNNNTSSEWHYYISSRELTSEELLKYARAEWSIESMHWLLDVHFLEDKTKVWDMNVQQNLNIMRKTALNLAREYKNRFEPKKTISGILKRNLFDINNLAKFIRSFVALVNVTDSLLN